jgi:hypothetical protein
LLLIEPPQAGADRKRMAVEIIKAYLSFMGLSFNGM